MIEELKAARNRLYPINKAIYLTHRTIGEIIDFGENKYAQLVNLFCLTPYDLMVELWDMGIEDYESLSNYDIFLMLYQNPRYQEWMPFILEGYNFQLGYAQENTDIILYDSKKQIVFDQLAYETTSQYMKFIHFIHHEEQDKVQGGTAGLKKILVETKRAEKHEQNRQMVKSSLNQYISALVWGNSNGITYQTVYDLKVYQFYDGLYRLQKIKNSANLLTGIYSGSLDAKNIDKENLSWMA